VRRRKKFKKGRNDDKIIVTFQTDGKTTSYTGRYEELEFKGVTVGNENDVKEVLARMLTALRLGSPATARRTVESQEGLKLLTERGGELVKPHEVAAGGGMPGAVPLRGRHGAKTRPCLKRGQPI